MEYLRSLPEDPLPAEREIDLARLRDAVLSRWWIAVAGLVVGGLIGAVYSLSGGSVYTASALIAPGRAFSPSGTEAVLTYLTNETAIDQIATSTATLEVAAAKARVSVGELRGHVTISAAAQTANRPAALVEITVQLSRPKRAEDAANAIAAIVRRVTSSGYIRQSLSIYGVKLANYAARLETLRQRIQSLNQVLAQPAKLQPLDRLVLVSELDQAEAAQGSTLASQTLTQQELTLAKNVEQTQVIQQAKAQKSTGRSRRNSVLVGALIGLILGVIIAAAVARGSGSPLDAAFPDRHD